MRKWHTREQHCCQWNGYFVSWMNWDKCKSDLSGLWQILFDRVTFHFIFFVIFLDGPRNAKRVFGHMWTAKAQISLRIRAVWSGPSLSAYRIIGYYRINEWRAKTRMTLAHAQHDLNTCMHILRIFEGTFSLDTAQMIFCKNKAVFNIFTATCDNNRLLQTA